MHLVGTIFSHGSAALVCISIRSTVYFGISQYNNVHGVACISGYRCSQFKKKHKKKTVKMASSSTVTSSFISYCTEAISLIVHCISS